VLGYEILLRIKFLDGIWRINHIAILRDRLNWIGADYEEKEGGKKGGGGLFFTAVEIQALENIVIVKW
jgi:hypothetical protein